MKIIKIPLSLFIAVSFGIIFLNACSPVRNLTSSPAPWSGGFVGNSQVPKYDKYKKNVFIIADCKLTVLFDMLAPFYLFNATEQANVYIVAKDKTPILIKRDLFILPQLTFNEVDSMGLRADAIVIPALSVRDEHQDTLLIGWIKKHFTPDTKMLAICDGAATAAATGFYDGKPITCHASDYENLRSHFNGPVWVKDVSVTKSGNLFSTAGVSNAVEGSLAVIDELFGREVMQKLLTVIHYSGSEIKYTHQSIAVNGKHKWTVAKKILFKKNRNIGLLLENDIDEFMLASILEIYGRTFPASFKTYSLNGSTVSTRYGLSIIYTGNNIIKGLDELHLVMPESFSETTRSFFKNRKIVKYDNIEKQYPVNICLKRIAEQYGDKFGDFVKISLDYN